jgi:glycosyltransferase involved in cell wall biosynthesis
VVLFAAHGVRKNIWKDYLAMQGAIQEVGRQMQREAILFIALGEGGEPKQVGHAQIRFVPFTEDPTAVARYYQAADVYLHAARADTFPNTVLEALACGTSVVATAVGGIPEQVDEGRTGFLVPPGDAKGLADRVIQLLSNEDLQKRLSQEAVRVARERYDARNQARAYLNWFEEIIETSNPRAATVTKVGASLTEVRV